MDIDSPFSSSEQTSISSSSNLLQYSPHRLITHTAAPCDQDLSHQQGISTLAALQQNIADDQIGVVTTKIAAISASLAECLIGNKAKLEIEMKNRWSKKRRRLNSDAGLDSQEISSNRTRFPSKSTIEVRRFAMLHRILELSNNALISGTVTTKRDIYYNEMELFTTQSVVDRYVDDISHTLGVNRDALNVVAAAKGLVVGDLSVTNRGGVQVKYSSDTDGLSVPKANDLVHLWTKEAQWVLVIEKHASFNTLATSKYWQTSSAGTGILITAKGYPDIQTRQFLYLLSTTFPYIPIFALVDYDPDGIGIMSTYKYGSKSLAHETNLNVPSIQWLGVRSSDATKIDVRDGVLRLTKRDRNRATKLLERQDIATGVQEQRRELQVMLMLNMKAEIQILGQEDQLGTWLDRKLTAAVNEAKVDDDGDILML